MGPQARVRADSPSVLRRINSALILEVIRAHGPLSRTEIARATGLSKPTVNDVVALLLEATYVRETVAQRRRRSTAAARPASAAPDVPGRPRPRPRPRHRRRQGAGPGLRPVRAHPRPRAAPHSQKARAGQRVLLRELEGAGAAALATAGVEPASLRAVGAGTPGVVDPATGRIALAPQLEGWEGLELGRELGSAFGCPAFVDNETNLSLLGERWQGAVVGVRNALYVQVGVGIGGAILIDGEVTGAWAGRPARSGTCSVRRTPSRRSSAPVRSSGLPARGRTSASAPRAAAGPAGALLLEVASGEPECVTAELVFAAAPTRPPCSTPRW